MKLFLLFLCAFLLSCGDKNNKALVDFDKESQELLITVHVYKNQKSLIKGTAKYNTKHQVGLTVWNNIDNKCDIHVIRPKNIESLHDETWGHELRHCVYGTFHKE